MSYQALAFFTGLFGSLHCVAMCGPLMLALPFQKTSTLSLIVQGLAYQLGRTFTYSILGIVCGLVGSQFLELGWQKPLTLLTGLVLIAFAIPYFLPEKFKLRSPVSFKLSNSLASLLGKFLLRPYGGFAAGIINGLLPCGMVYMALAGSLSMASMSESTIFMAFFGLGTTPLMLLAALSPLFIKRRLKFASLTPYLFLIVGFWLCLRGGAIELPFMHINHPGQSATCD